jgi:hypothetical protein
LLVVGANFVAGVTVLVPGAVATVLDAGSYSLLIQLAGEATGALTVLSEGNSSNPMAVTP